MAFLYGTVQGFGKQYLHAVHFPLSIGAFSKHCAVHHCRLSLSSCAQAWSAQMSEGWLSGEDLLLARAMRRFGKQQLKIQQYFLPTRTAADISARIKHLTRISAPPNPVKVWPEAFLQSECCSQKGFSEIVPVTALAHTMYITSWAFCESDLA